MPIINPNNIDITYPDLPNAVCLGKMLDALVPAYPEYEFHIKNKISAEVIHLGERLGQVEIGWLPRFGDSYSLMNPRVKQLNWRKGYYETSDFNKYLTMFRRTMLPKTPEQVMVGASTTLQSELRAFIYEMQKVFGEKITESLYARDPNDKTVVDTLEVLERLLAGTVANKVIEKVKDTYALSHSLITAYNAGNYILVRTRGTQLLIQLSGDSGVFVRDRIKSDAVNTKFALLKVLDPDTALADVGYRLSEDLFFIIAYIDNGDAVT
jgi:hypothetical protein